MWKAAYTTEKWLLKSKHMKTVEKRINTGNIYDLNIKDDGLAWKLEF